MGKQDITNLNLPVVIALKDGNGEEIYRGEHLIGEQQTSLELITDQQVATAAIDPDYILPSAFLKDNVKTIRSER